MSHTVVFKLIPEIRAAARISFKAEDEPTSARQHFVTEFGWSEAEFRRIKHSEWFAAKVSVSVEFEDGAPIEADQYLGCCMYNQVSDFYTKNANGYFADMVREALGSVLELARMHRSDTVAELIDLAVLTALDVYLAKQQAIVDAMQAVSVTAPAKAA